MENLRRKSGFRVSQFCPSLESRPPDLAGDRFSRVSLACCSVPFVRPAVLHKKRNKWNKRNISVHPAGTAELLLFRFSGTKAEHWWNKAEHAGSLPLIRLLFQFVPSLFGEPSA